MLNNHDVWAIQNHPNELNRALSYIRPDSDDNILYTNLVSDFYLNDRVIKKLRFTSLLDSEQNNTSILLSSNTNIMSVRRHLQATNILYNEVSFNPGDVRYGKFNTLKDFYFAQREEVVRKVLRDTYNRYGTTNGYYYPNIKATLQLSYFSKSFTLEPISRLDFSGLIALRDSLILLVDHQQENNLKKSDVLALLKDSYVKTYIKNKGEPNNILVNSNMVKEETISLWKQSKILI